MGPLPSYFTEVCLTLEIEDFNLKKQPPGLAVVKTARKDYFIQNLFYSYSYITTILIGFLSALRRRLVASPYITKRRDFNCTLQYAIHVPALAMVFQLAE